MSLTDANAVFEGRLPGEEKGSWIVTARRTYYDLVANSLVGTELPAFGDLQGRLDWNLRPGTRLTFFGLLSREATDAFFEGDRAGEQGDFVTTARNDLAALKLTTLLGRSVSSRTIASYYVNRDDIGAMAQFRNEARRSNAPSDDVGFGLADIDFSRELGVRDLSLRQELAWSTGAHLVESGLEVHQLRTETAWLIEGDRNPTASNGSSVQGGAGLPSDLDSAVDSTRFGAWLQDRWQAGKSLSLEAGLRLDWSGVNRRTTALAPRLRHPAAGRRDAAPRGGRALHAEPRLREAHPVRLLRGPLGGARALAPLRAGGARGRLPRARLRRRPERAGRRATGRASTTSSSAGSRPRRSGSPASRSTTSRPSSPRAFPRTPSSRASP